MSDAVAKGNLNKPNGAILGARIVTWVVPIMLWVIHIFVIVPILNTQGGDAQFLSAMYFFVVSGLLMIGCLLISLLIYVRNQSWGNLVPILLNLSWLYYLKVVFYGPTIGNL
jgi:hypothetical protein